MLFLAKILQDGAVAVVHGVTHGDLRYKKDSGRQEAIFVPVWMFSCIAMIYKKKISVSVRQRLIIAMVACDRGSGLPEKWRTLLSQQQIPWDCGVNGLLGRWH